MKTSVVYLAVLLSSCLVHRACSQHEGDQGRSDSSRSLSQFNAPGRALQQRAEDAENENERLIQLTERLFGTDNDLMQEVRELEIFKKAVVDPVCSMTINCSSNDSRVIVDGIEFRTMNGSCNNVDNFSWGMAGIQHLRWLPPAYENNSPWRARNFSDAPGSENVNLPNPRNISNYVHNTTNDKSDTEDVCSLALFYFMQFIDHELIKTPEGSVGKTDDCCETPSKRFCLTIFVTEPDDGYYPQGHCMDLRRSETVLTCTNNTADQFQNQLNELTAYIDGSMIYGSTIDQMNELRTFIGGRLIVTTDRFMPDAEDPSELPCDIVSPYKCFAAGDTRSNVHPGLTTFHTIFVREHNRIATVLAREHSTWSDERIFQETRKIVAAEIQHIVFNEMLQIMLDASYISSYELDADHVYNSSLDASIYSSFAIAFRYHNFMPSLFHLTEHTGDTYTTLSVEQHTAFKKPSHLLNNSYSGIDRVALGMATSDCPVTNGRVNNASRNLLFATSSSLGLDLAAINIVRAREWGVPPYVQFREWCGNGIATTWDDLNTTHTDQDVIDALQRVYLDVGDIDLWVGVMTEDKVGSSLSGPTQSCIVAHQFYNVKNGDRFWFENTGFTQPQITAIKELKLSRIMCDNLNVSEMPEYVFDTDSTKIQCDSDYLPKLNLSLF